MLSPQQFAIPGSPAVDAKRNFKLSIPNFERGCSMKVRAERGPSCLTIKK